MKCLVTGGTGLVGAHIARSLVGRGASVRVLARPGSDRAAIAGMPIETVEGDVLNRRSVRKAVAGCDFVFHAASDFTYWGKTASDLDKTALTGTRNVLEAAAGAANPPRVVVTSSSVVLGYSDDPVPKNEQSTPRDEAMAPYVASKIRQDALALERARELELEVVLACPTVVVGPFAPRLGPSNGLVCAYLDDPLRLTYPGGCNIVAASDVGHGHVLAALSGHAGERYVLGGQNVEWRDLHALVSSLCGTYGPTLTATRAACYVAAFGEEVRSRLADRSPLTTRTQATMVGRYYWYSHRKAASLGYAPMTARDALAIALAWLVASPHVPRETRTRLRLDDRVWIARRALRDSEAALRAGA